MSEQIKHCPKCMTLSFNIIARSCLRCSYNENNITDKLQQENSELQRALDAARAMLDRWEDEHIADIKKQLAEVQEELELAKALAKSKDERIAELEEKLNGK